VKRPKQHITDSLAGAIFRGAFPEWAVNGSQCDYGWDYVVEVFRNNESTGLLFSVQLKGWRHTKYSDGTFISQALEQDAADYLARHLRLPTFLFHAGVNAKKLFWSSVQPKGTRRVRAREGKGKGLTVRIPAVHLLPSDVDRFVVELAQSQTVVVSRILLGTKPTERITQVAEDLHEKGFHLDLQTNG
jgi:hypothetical protein